MNNNEMIEIFCEGTCFRLSSLNFYEGRLLSQVSNSMHVNELVRWRV